MTDSEDLIPLEDEFGNQLFVATEDVSDLLDVEYKKDTELFSVDQLGQSLQDFNLIEQVPDIQIEDLEEKNDQLLTLDKDLEASGDCIILYSECNFKGVSKKTCDNPEEALSFELPIQSIYVPDGQMITIYDQKELVSHAFMQSAECLKTPILLSFIPSDVIFSHNSGNAFQVTDTDNQEQEQTESQTV